MSSILWRIAAVLFVVAAIVASFVIHRKGWEQTVTALPHLPTACPQGVPAILVIGQSHASNTGPFRHWGRSEAYAFAQNRCYHLRDPMPGTGGRGGSVWPAFAAALGQKVLIADIAVSGSAIEDWVTPGQLKTVRDTLLDLQTAGYSQPLVIWMQGETNGARRTSAQSYYSSLLQLHDTAPKSRWLITDESRCYDKQEKWLPLDRARRLLVRDRAGVSIGPDLDRLSLEFRQNDRCHLTREGQRLLADLLAAAAKPLLKIDVKLE